MQTETNKILVIVFRICVIAAFLCGLIYDVVFFNVFGGSGKDFGAMFTVFYVYLALALAGLALSIVCFKSTSTLSSVFRTISLAVIVILLFRNISFIKLLNELWKLKDSTSYDQLMRLNEKVNQLANNYNAMGRAFGAIGTVPVMLILSVTSVVALIKVLKNKPGNAA